MLLLFLHYILATSFLFFSISENFLSECFSYDKINQGFKGFIKQSENSYFSGFSIKFLTLE